jgi:hypothetical protein
MFSFSGLKTDRSEVLNEIFFLLEKYHRHPEQFTYGKQ